ncbi:MAG: PA2778 family cysteine peptidase [Thiotrichales bacterium]|nr:MAG: PA2778 family cysteine peptidase [Thiotrichales bacterium]
MSNIAESLPPVVELSQTPFNPQTSYHCGPAALSTVMQSHGVDISVETLTPYLYIPERKGSLQIEMAVAARRFGMLPYPLEHGLADLLTEIAAGNPVLVLQNLRFEGWPQWHYAVVVGYDMEQQELVLRSGTTERWLTSFDNFETTWKRADRWALVIVPAGEIPATASVSSYLETVYAFEETGMTGAAAKAYRAATQQWPDDATVWLSRGNLAYQTGQTAEAVSMFTRAASLDPDSAVIWNNLAYALHRYGCAEQAVQSLQCARRLSPDDENIRHSEREIEHMALHPQAGNCPEITCD